MTNPDYSYWRDALAGQDMTSRTHDGEPQLGFFRNRVKNKTTGSISWRPVAYYMQDGKIVCNINGRIVDDQAGREAWTYVCRFPVTEQAWRAVVDDGLPWPDQDAIVAEQTRGIGDNSGALDEKEALSDQIKSAAEGKKAYLKITDETKLPAAQSLRSRLLELAGQAEKIRKAKADPLHKAWKAVNDQWNPLIDEATGAAAAIKNGIDSFLTAQLQAQREAEASGDDMMEPVAAPAPMPAQIKGGYGRAASVKPQWIIKEITDYDALYQHFKDKVAVKEILEKLAKAEVKNGEVPGVIRTEVARTK